MKIGIVGCEKAKFTPETEKQAREIIRSILQKATLAISGHCHLGGIDIWLEEEADKLSIPKLIFPPAKLSWEGGYKQRNLEIAYRSDIVHCITIKTLPEHYIGMQFEICYHCEKHPNGCKEPHIKSGGCWTALKCKQRKWWIV